MADPRPAIEILRRLVALDTTSAKSNLPLIQEVADYLDRFRIKVRLSGEDTSVKANLFATIGPEEPGGIVLSGHSDVVPVAGQPWTTDPFRLAERDGRLYGRGTTDMKGFIACTLALVPELAAARLEQPVHLAFSYDEEVGCVGVRSLISLIGSELPRPKLAIIGEPTEMKVVNAHKGISSQTTTVTGRDGHSSRPQAGVNAVAYAAEIIGFLNRLAEEYGSRSEADPRFDPPGTTFNVGIISGGTAVNIIARECRFRWEFRPAPGIDPGEILDRLGAFVAAAILPRMRAVDRRADVVTTVDAAAPPLVPIDGSPAEELALQLSGTNACHAVSYVCEAGLFARAGVPAVVCGPGSIAQAHQPDEYVAISQLEACSAFLRRLVPRVTTRPAAQAAPTG
jgi:acetylornithine deacetylase